MKIKLLPLTLILLSVIWVRMNATAQSFTNMSSEIGATYNSGGCVGVTDMDNDGYDDIIVLHDSRHLRIVYQTPSGFNPVNYGTVSGNEQWGMAIGNFTNSGHNDVICGGAYDGVHYTSISEIGQSTAIDLANGSMFMQACNVADIDNDGHLDFFACHDDGLSRMWRNNGVGALQPNTSFIDLTDYDFTNFPDTDHSGNYGSVWCDIDDDGDLDLFIAKCRQFVSNPFDPRRINQLWINDGNGNFTEQGEDRGIVLYEQSWTVDFADVNNDGFFDCLITTHSSTLKLLMNDGNGYFTDVTEEAGLAESGFFLQAKMVDFDNDGWVDLVYAGGVHSYFKNDGDGTFTQVANVFPYNDTMHSFGIGDMDKDGFLDLYASYGEVYVGSDANNSDILWMNDGNANNWVGFDLQGIASNMNAIGAKVKIYGDWGVQIREVRAGESYGIVNSFHVNFGLGANEGVDQVVIEWPSGAVTTINDPAINTYHNIFETECQLVGLEFAIDGALSLCPGEITTLTAPDGYSYLWSNGQATQSITVDASGFYSVVLSDDNGCIGATNAVGITVLQATIPTITANGELEFCEGGEIELISSPGSSYTWSNGANSQVITVTESGVYNVAVVDDCSSAVTSESVEVIIYEAPLPLASVEVVVTQNGDDFVEVDADMAYWYDSEDATTPIFMGNPMPVNLSENTTFWVENVMVYGGETSSGGQLANTTDGGQYHGNSNFWLIFDANTDIVLESVKVFSGQEGNRTIALIDANGAIVQQATVNIPQGEFEVQLDFDVPAGIGYGLRTLDNNPQLWRDGPPAQLGYPYDLGGLATIVQSSVTGQNSLNFYYFFYDWKVRTPEIACSSDRTAVQVIVSNVANIHSAMEVNIYPNPVRDVLSIEFNGNASETVHFEVCDLVGKVVYSRQVASQNGLNRNTFDLSTLSAGTYLLSMETEGIRSSWKVIVD